MGEERGRRSVRLKGYSYCGPADYFVTICSYQRKCIFGTCSEGTVLRSSLGEIIDQEWRKIPELRPGVILDEFVVMPNHFHALIFLPHEETAATQRLAAVIRGFKAASTKGDWKRELYRMAARLL